MKPQLDFNNLSVAASLGTGQLTKTEVEERSDNVLNVTVHCSLSYERALASVVVTKRPGVRPSPIPVLRQKSSEMYLLQSQ